MSNKKTMQKKWNQQLQYKGIDKNFEAGYRFHLGNRESIRLEQFYNDETLNLFCDGSYMQKQNLGGYAVVGVCKDTILDVSMKASYGNSSGYMEIKGLRLATSMANYFNQFPYVNIFCDNVYAIDAISKYIYTWYYDKNKESFMTSAKQAAKYQELIYETTILFQNMCSKKESVQLIYYPAHVGNGYKELCTAAEDFRRLNKTYCKIDLNFIRYICSWSNFVDNAAKQSRERMFSKLVSMNKDERFCSDAIQFHPVPVETTMFKMEPIMKHVKM